MENQEENKKNDTLRIIEALAEGVNPHTGEFLSHETILQDPQVIRALFAAVDAIKARMNWQERRDNRPKRAGEPWTDQESMRLVESFDQDLSMSKIARQHERTPGAIKSQLQKLGRIN